MAQATTTPNVPTTGKRRVSVVICCHDVERWDVLTTAIESVQSQRYEQTEVVFVSDGDPDLGAKVRSRFPGAIVTTLKENKGLLQARNAGAEAATGDVVAFLDDDAIAAPHWVGELIRCYEEKGAIAAGGKLLPKWSRGRPMWLPGEYDWLVGATHTGFAGDTAEVTEVRNTFGSNLSFRADVFDAIGGFDPEMGGRVGDGQLQGGETELCARLKDEFGAGVHYSPLATVHHQVGTDRTSLSWAIERAYYQGVSKARLEDRLEGADDEESDYLKQLVVDALPRRIVQLVVIPLLTFSVGMGYLRALFQERVSV